MAGNKKPNTVTVCEKLAQPVAESMGLELWDVRFEKEGGTWYLRYFIDKEGGVNIDDCEKFSRAVDKLLDEADPIDQSYCLEVSSPGVERELTRPAHFQRYMGKQIMVRFIRPVQGTRDWVGELIRAEGDEIAIAIDEETELSFRKNETAYIRLYDDFDYGGQKR